MPEPPATEADVELPDFRRASVQGGESAPLRRAILRAHRQQDAIQDILDENGQLALPALKPVELNRKDVDESALLLRAALKLEGMPAGLLRRPEELLRTLVRNTESLGYLVIQVQRVDVTEMRGFSLASGLAPVVALNGADWPRGKIFTLLHELAHIGLHQSGLCDLSRRSKDLDERFCDAVAATALMPTNDFRARSRQADPLEYADLRAVGDHFGTSAEAVLLRMVHLNLATWDDYDRQRAEFKDAYSRFKLDEKHAREGKDAPIYYQLKVRAIGRAFINTIARARDDGSVSSRDVTQLLEVSYDKLPKLLERVRAGDAA